MTEDAYRLNPRDILQLYPVAVVERLFDDDEFRARLELEDGLLLVLEGAGRFARRPFYAAVRTLHAGAAELEVYDIDGHPWTIVAVDVGGRPALRLSRGGAFVNLHPHHALHPDASLRIAELDRSLAETALWPEALPAWRGTLGARSLDDDEVRRYQQAFESTPRALAGRIEISFARRTGDAALIAPDDRAHYTNLIGGGIASSVGDLARSVVLPHVQRLLSVADGSGPRMALLLAAHSSLLSTSELERLREEELSALVRWATEEGDLLSRVGAIEVGLASLARLPSLATPLVPLVASVLAQDPDDRAGRLALVSGVVAFVGAELSRTGLLGDLPPFQRRLAIFAQASFFERTVFGRIDVGVVADWARRQGLRRFYFQTMVERRLEPRWTAEYVEPAQLKAEFVSRISLAAGLHEAHVPPGLLHDLLFGDAEGGVKAQVRFPQNFLPGPLEGLPAEDGRLPLPEHFERMLDETLAADVLEPRSVIALINLRGVFAIDAGRVDRAVELIRAAGHRFAVSVDAETRQLLFNGLAALAAETRNAGLAEEVRMMVRKDRLDGDATVPLRDEFAMALNAAAAHAEWEDWSAYLGDWCVELAFQAEGQDARDLRDDLDLLCAIDPALRGVLGAGRAALASVTSPL